MKDDEKILLVNRVQCLTKSLCTIDKATAVGVFQMLTAATFNKMARIDPQAITHGTYLEQFELVLSQEEDASSLMMEIMERVRNGKN